jgi:hypothetical protein
VNQREESMSDDAAAILFILGEFIVGLLVGFILGIKVCWMIVKKRRLLGTGPNEANG